MEVRHSVFLLLFSLHLCSSFLFSSGSLYNSTDDVVILDDKNFYSSVIGADHGWVIEFYNSWCGHCIHFAPTWKQFAKDIRDWKHTVKVGVIDCAVDDSIPICREYEIMGYPSMKLFAAKPSKGDIGTQLSTRTVEEMEKSVIDFLGEKQKANNGSASWVNLQPYKGALGDVWLNMPETAEYVVVIVDHPKSHIGKQTVLDLGGYEKIAMLLTDDGRDVIDMRPGSSPGIIYIDRYGKREVVSNAAATREELTTLIQKKFNLHRNMLSFNREENTGAMTVHRKTDVEGAGDGRPEEIHSDKLNYEDDLPDTGFPDNERKDQVYMVDIENAVSYALKHEAVQKKVIKGEALKALEDFLEVLVLYLPARPAIHEFLSRLHKYISDQDRLIEGHQLFDAITSLQDEQSVLPHRQPWIGCHGSEAKYRGYPCGLWTTFHTLAVNAGMQDGSNPLYDPKKVLRAIHGYIKYFFSCKYCAQHFDEMYQLDAESSVNVADDEILWLWRGHNKVNRRLNGEPSEDPRHPKIQFPSPAACPSCWDGDTSKEKEVLAYLKNIYFKRSLSFKGTQTIVAPPPMNRQAKVKALVDQYQNDRVKVNHKRYSSEQDQHLGPLHTWGFNNTDISLCVLLYVISTVIIMSVYCLVIIRRKMRKKKFLEFYKQPEMQKRVEEDIVSRINTHFKNGGMGVLPR